MKDYYARLDLPPSASQREIERELESLGDAVLRRNARHVLLDQERRAFYDRCHRKLRELAELRARLGLNRGPFWLLSDCDDFTTEAFGQPVVPSRRPLVLPLVLLLTVAVTAWWGLQPRSAPPPAPTMTAADLPRRITISEPETQPQLSGGSSDWESWYPRYREQIQPIRSTWTALTSSLDEGSFELADPRCRRLQRAVAACERERLFPSPELELDEALGRLLDRLEAVASSCRRGRFFSMTERLDEAQEDWDRVERLLRRRALEP